MFRLQTPTFNWPKQEFCTLYIFYYKETENIYPSIIYLQTRSPFCLLIYILPLSAIASTIHTTLVLLYFCFYFSFIRMCTLTRFVHSLPLSIFLPLFLPFALFLPTQKILYEEEKKSCVEGKEKKLSDSFSYLNKDSALFSYTWFPLLDVMFTEKKAQLVFFFFLPSFVFSCSLFLLFWRAVDDVGGVWR